MDKIIKMDTIHQYNELRGLRTLHPLITIFDLSTALAMPTATFQFNIFSVFLKELYCGDIRYGRNNYDYQEGTMVFVAPGQVISVQPNTKDYEAKGWALLFHPDLLLGTQLSKNMDKYSFFNYEVHEALHISEKEKDLVKDCFRKLIFELDQSVDKHSKTLLTSHIELLLNYCTRFYDRQFITRDTLNKNILEKFELILNEYFKSNNPLQLGIPSVTYCAESLNLSTNYFGDLIKKETGKSAQEHIQTKLIDLAKIKIFEYNKSISEIAFELGFKYPQHFTRLFKQKTGMSPTAYRQLN